MAVLDSTAACPHWVRVTYKRVLDLIEVEGWMKDPDRPGFFYWKQRENVWHLRISDPDVAFEARLRWS